METISVALICTITGAIISYFTFQRNRTNDIRADTREGTETRTMLNYISKGVDDIRIDIKSQARDIQAIKERLVKCEESTKSAHKRINDIEERGGC